MVEPDPLANALSAIKNAEGVGKKNAASRPYQSLSVTSFASCTRGTDIGDFELVEDGKTGVFKIELLGNINRCGAINREVLFTELISKDGNSGICRRATSVS